MLDEKLEQRQYIAKLFNLPLWKVVALIKAGYELPELEQRLEYETADDLIKVKTTN